MLWGLVNVIASPVSEGVEEGEWTMSNKVTSKTIKNFTNLKNVQRVLLQTEVA